MINTAGVAEIDAGERILERSGSRGEVVERLRDRIDLLLPNDRILIELVLSGAVTRARAAELLGVPAGTVSRRVKRVSERLYNPIVGALMEPRCPLSPDYRQVGVEHFLTGLTLGALAAKHGIGPREVRRRIEFVRGWYRGLVARGMR